MRKTENYHCPALGRAIAKMPPEGIAHDYRQSADEPFVFARSPMVQWLLGHEEILSYLFLRLQRMRLIIFDATTGRWIANPAHPDITPSDDE